MFHYLVRHPVEFAANQSSQVGELFVTMMDIGWTVAVTIELIAYCTDTGLQLATAHLGQ